MTGMSPQPRSRSTERITVAVNERPQDVGRKHAAKGTPATVQDRALIERWQAAERATLERVTIRLEGVDKGMGIGEVPIPREYPSNSETAVLIDLGVKIARDLGSAIDPDPAPSEPPKSRPTAPRRNRKRKLDI